MSRILHTSCDARPTSQASSTPATGRAATRDEGLAGTTTAGPRCRPSPAEQSAPPGEPAEHKLPISAFIICLNEERALANCLESLVQCAEIVIVDSGSTDSTPAIVDYYLARGWPIRFLTNPWSGYSAQKQFALEHCTYPWCLSIDADERLDSTLRQALPQLIKAPSAVAAWRLPRRPYFLGYGYAGASVREGKFLRLFRNGRGYFNPALKVHEQIVVEGEIRTAQRGSLLHFCGLPIEEQVRKANNYSNLKTEQLIERGQQPRLFKLVCNPLLYFLRLYFHNGYWRCGAPGFIQAGMGAVYSFLTESKIYQHHAQLRKPPLDDLAGELAPAMSSPAESPPAQTKDDLP